MNLVRGLSLQGSVSHQTSKREGVSDVNSSAPNFMAKLGADYHFNKGISFAVFNTHIGEEGRSRQSTDVPKPYNLLTANMRFDLNQLPLFQKLPNAEFSIYGDNLLDKRIATYRSSNPSVNFLKNSGRAFYGKLTIKF